MFRIDDEVLLKALDESPKFRKDYIETQLNKDSELVLEIVDHYKLKLIKEIYTQDISIHTYNSKKRVRLKNQEIILIKKMKVFNHLNQHMKQLVDSVVSVDVGFTDYFGDDYHFVSDRDFTYSLIFKYLERYFEEYEKRSKNKE
ncbi:hypothetical protein RZE82_03505 [Mollicutes bacterium LVI A0039]|nr:hypothetical protein RZE82_03505 [Mollicutes bacterium LVI A0039]